jgi:hypothetical protein
MKMKTNRFFAGIPAMVLVFVLAFAGCGGDSDSDNGGDDNGGGNGSGGGSGTGSGLKITGIPVEYTGQYLFTMCQSLDNLLIFGASSVPPWTSEQTMFANGARINGETVTLPCWGPVSNQGAGVGNKYSGNGSVYISLFIGANSQFDLTTVENTATAIVVFQSQYTNFNNGSAAIDWSAGIKMK